MYWLYSENLWNRFQTGWLFYCSYLLQHSNPRWWWLSGNQGSSLAPKSRWSWRTGMVKRLMTVSSLRSLGSAGTSTGSGSFSGFSFWNKRRGISHFRRQTLITAHGPSDNKVYLLVLSSDCCSASSLRISCSLACWRPIGQSSGTVYIDRASLWSSSFSADA